jgi:hypothetical protein
MKTYYFFNLLLIASLAGCSKLEDPSAISPADKLNVTVSKASMQYNNLDSVLVTAKVPEAAGLVDVTFTASHGKFVYSAAATVKQITDSLAGDYRYAKVWFKADTTTGIYYFTAEAASQRARIPINVTK